LSKYDVAPLDFAGLATIPIAERGGKVRLEHMGVPPEPGLGFATWLDRLPKLLAADSLRGVAAALREARAKGRARIWGMGGHVIKCGLAPILVDLIDRDYITALAMNGAGAIHDFEIGIAGATSEDVEAVLPDGRFGSAEETGREMNAAIVAARERGIGIGEALGEHLDRIARPEFAPGCLLLQAWRRGIPVTVHVAVGTDTPHTHPSASGEAIGAGTHHDFRLFCSLVRGLDGGGVYMNIGSAVVMPEVFLKAVSVVRNLGHPLTGFTTVNFDFLQHYRPKVNVVDRPHAKAGGRGFAITGHHELLVPLLAAILADLDTR
jgi:GNAT superfamily N-acetyltransferase